MGFLDIIRHRTLGDCFDSASKRFDRHVDRSKNKDDVSKPETVEAGEEPRLQRQMLQHMELLRLVVYVGCECDSPMHNMVLLTPSALGMP